MQKGGGGLSEAGERKWLKISQVAERLQFSYWSIWRRVQSGEIQAKQIGGGWRIDPEWLDSYLRGKSA